jgi:hypothetical protein
LTHVRHAGFTDVHGYTKKQNPSVSHREVGPPASRAILNPMQRNDLHTERRDSPMQNSLHPESCARFAAAAQKTAVQNCRSGVARGWAQRA